MSSQINGTPAFFKLKYLPATSSKSARVKVSGRLLEKPVTVSWDHSLNSLNDHLSPVLNRFFAYHVIMHHETDKDICISCVHVFFV